MKYLITVVIVFLLLGISACSGANRAKSCDDVRRYQLAERGDPVKAPDGLDELNELREMPLPEANPRPPRPEGSPCLDLPPSVLSSGS
jgi:uncharacterized lipoprotein